VHGLSNVGVAEVPKREVSLPHPSATSATVQGAPGFVVSAGLAGLLAVYPTRFLTGFAPSLRDVLRDVFLAVLSL
jgi:hypothetical protein